MSIEAGVMSMMEDWLIEFLEEGLSEEDAEQAVWERYDQINNQRRE